MKLDNKISLMRNKQKIKKFYIMLEELHMMSTYGFTNNAIRLTLFL